MRLTALAVVLGATLEGAFAEVTCDSKALHYRRTAVPAAEKADIFNTITQFCASTEQGSLESTSGTTVFAIAGAGDSPSRSDCEAQFKSIVEECIFSKNTVGGNVLNDGIQFTVSMDSSKLGANKPRGLGGSNKKTTKAAKTTKPVEKTTKPAEKTTKASSTVAKASSTKASSATAKASSTEKASSATGKTSSATGKASSATEKASSTPGKISPTPGKVSPTPGKVSPTPTPTPKPTPSPAPACNLPQKDQKPAGQTKTGAARRFISKLLGRASTGGQPDTAPAAACGVGQGGGPINVMKLPGWGETWFGIQWFPAQKTTITNQELFWSAKDAYNKIMAQSSPSSVVLVAALFVPGRGIYFGTIPRDVGVDKFKTECEARAPHLWQVIGGKKIIDTNNKSQTLWHAEDAAMFWATRQAQIQGSFPENAKLLNYGRINNIGQAVQVASCDTQTAADRFNRPPNFPGNTTPDCAGNVLDMNVALAGTVPMNQQQRPAA